MLGVVIKKIAEEKEISIKSLALSIGMSEQNLHRCFKRNSIETKNLEKIASILSVPISTFFEEDQALAISGIRTNNKSTAIYVSKDTLGIDEEELDRLVKEIVKNALNGMGLVYLEYRHDKFETVYEPLKKKLTKTDIQKIISDIHFFNEYEKDQRGWTKDEGFEETKQ